MTWLSFDDGYTRQKIWEGVSFEARWLYHAIVETCSATGRHDGVLRWIDARRCSDVPDPDGAVKELLGTGLLEDLGGAVRATEMDHHLPPPHLRSENLLPRKRANQAAWRKARCEEGKHSRDCPRATCPVKIARDLQRVTGNASGNGSGNAGTGRDGSGSANHLTVVNGENSASAQPLSTGTES